jgi:Zn-dependent protease
MTIRFSKKHGTIKIGQYQKAPIYLHLTFFITGVILAWPFWSRGNLRDLALALLFIAVIFASVLLHELSHAAMAFRYRLPAVRIDIHALGGLVQFWPLPLTRRQDFAVTLAGPLCNLAIALIALALLALVPPPESQTIEINGRLFSFLKTEKGFWEPLLRASAYLNLGLCAVNLIPAFPLDGGKLVYLAVDEHWGPRTATLVVSVLGLVFACVSTLVLIGSMLAGFPIWAPPGFAINWLAFRSARRGRGGWNRYAIGA